jgi:hypothetical protein
MSSATHLHLRHPFSHSLIWTSIIRRPPVAARCRVCSPPGHRTSHRLCGLNAPCCDIQLRQLQRGAHNVIAAAGAILQPIPPAHVSDSMCTTRCSAFSTPSASAGGCSTREAAGANSAPCTHDARLVLGGMGTLLITVYTSIQPPDSGRQLMPNALKSCSSQETLS